MKILLVCCAGMSTGILMQKMEAYWTQQGEELQIEAAGMSEYEDVYQNYDIVLMGPQVSYRMNEVQEATGLPCAAINPTDYALHNCAKIMDLARQLYAQVS